MKRKLVKSDVQGALEPGQAAQPHEGGAAVEQEGVQACEAVSRSPNPSPFEASSAWWT